MISFSITLHALAGTSAILSGFGVLALAKATSLHKKLGIVFVLSMLALGLSGAWVAWQRSIMLSLCNGLLISYLVATAWLAVKPRSNWRRNLECVLLGCALGIVAMLLGFAIDAQHSLDGKKDGFGYQAYYFFALVSALAASMDVKMLVGGGLSAKAGLLRHIWRMCFALFMATAAFFLGQAKLFPEFMRHLSVLAIPVLLVLAVLLYWLYRVGLNKASFDYMRRV